MLIFYSIVVLAVRVRLCVADARGVSRSSLAWQGPCCLSGLAPPAAEAHEQTRGDRRWCAAGRTGGRHRGGGVRGWHLPSGDDKLTACRAIPPGASVTEIVAVLGQPVARQVGGRRGWGGLARVLDTLDRPGPDPASVHEPTGKVFALRCSADGPDTWAAKD